jgi:WD40 repeat protein
MGRSSHPVRTVQLNFGTRYKSTLVGHSDLCLCVSWSTTWLASASSDKTIRIWGLATGKCILTLKGHRDWVRSIAWSQDGKWLASGSDDTTIQVWELVTGQSTSTLDGYRDIVRSVTWSHDGTCLVQGTNGHIFTPQDGRKLTLTHL